ncbi:MAG: ABC transporter substrate-binding protein [Hyphomicrobiales bacterium]|jgi:branched-chain amino acid transport system substrate-binding protein|nr:ABC transporter substrate-binding protein [Hyphomicrobiales bacterium]MDE2373526.1 ABC transporter substrate-binding protein [Hyphomicrobiales bacterium]
MKVAGALAAALFGFCSLGAASAETIKIGVVLPYSGPMSDLGNQIDKAFDLYVKLHAKDLGDNKIELIKRDEGPPSGANARTVVTELITNDKVKLLTGFVFSPSAIAVAPLVTQVKMPMLIANAGTAWITNLSPYIARFSFSMWDPAYPMGTYAATKFNCKTAAAAFTDFPPGQDSTLAFKTAFEKAGGKVVDEVRLGPPGPVPDFTPFFQRVKDEHPDCFYVFVPSGSHAAGVMKTYGDLNMRKAGIRLIGPMDLIPDYELAHMSDAAIGLVVMASYSDDLDTPGNQAFVKAWHEAYGPNSYPDFMSAAGMDTMAGIFHVINTLHGNLDDGAKVIDALKGWKHEGVRGPIEIDPQTRDIIQPERAEEVIKKADGKLGIKVLETYPAVKDECKVLKLGRCGSGL